MSTPEDMAVAAQQALPSLRQMLVGTRLDRDYEVGMDVPAICFSPGHRSDFWML